MAAGYRRQPGACRDAGGAGDRQPGGCGGDRAGLDTIAGEYAENGVPEDWALEDIHMTTESRLATLIGPAAGRLHTARSRNDQVATDFRLWVRQACDEALANLAALQRALVERAGEHAGSIMPGFTHLQTAQPVTLGHHLLAITRWRRAMCRALPPRGRG